MGLIRDVFPQCDWCHHIEHDLAQPTASGCRSAMRADGWVKRGGQDVCEACAESLKAERKPA